MVVGVWLKARLEQVVTLVTSALDKTRRRVGRLAGVPAADVIARANDIIHRGVQVKWVNGTKNASASGMRVMSRRLRTSGGRAARRRWNSAGSGVTATTRRSRSSPVQV